MEKFAQKGVSLNLADHFSSGKLSPKQSPIASPLPSSKSQSYIRIYTASTKSKYSKELNDSRKLNHPTFLMGRPKRTLAELKSFMHQEKEPQNQKQLENKYSDAERNLHQAKSDFLDIKRDIATYEHELCTKVSLGLTLMKISKASSSLPTLIEDLQDFDIKTVGYLGLLGNKFSEINNLTTKALDPLNKEFVKEDLCVRTITNYTKLFLAYQAISNISGLHCSIQIMTNSLYNTLIIVVLLPSGHSIRTNLERRLIIPRVADIRRIIQDTIAPKLFITLSREELLLGWHEDYSVSFFTMITKLKGYPALMTMLTLKIKDKKGILVVRGESELYVSYSRLQVRKADKSTLGQIKIKFLKHLYYDQKSQHLEWVENANTIFEKKEKNSVLMDLDYIYEVLGIKLFHFHSYFMYEIDEKDFKIETWVYKEHAMLKVFKDLELIGQAESGSSDFKFITQLQILDIINNPLTLSRSLEFRGYLLRLEEESLIRNEVA